MSNKSNSTLFADMLRIAGNKADYESGPVYLVHAAQQRTS